MKRVFMQIKLRERFIFFFVKGRNLYLLNIVFVLKKNKVKLADEIDIIKKPKNEKRKRKKEKKEGEKVH